MEGLTKTEYLRAKGLPEIEAANKAQMFAACEAILASTGASSEPMYAFFVPGRLEVLGKHTDYAGGRSITCAIEKGFCLAAAARTDTKIRLFNTANGQTLEIDIADPPAQPKGCALYAARMCSRVAGDFPPTIRGADVAFASDLPPAAGMSSSSALIIGFFMAVSAVNDLPSHRNYTANITCNEDLAAYLACVENGTSFRRLAAGGGVGTLGGSEDHTAILCSEAGRLGMYRYLPTRREKSIPLPPEMVFAVASSGVAAEKTRNALEKYNRLSRMSEAMLAAWNLATDRSDRHPASALESSHNAAEVMEGILRTHRDGPFGGDELVKRLEHFITESDRIVPEAAQALESGNLRAFGAIAGRSQQLAERLLQNQLPQTSFLAKSAIELGAAAASSFGAGFGGGVWAMLGRDRAKDFSVQWLDRYRRKFPAQGPATDVFLTGAAPAAFSV